MKMITFIHGNQSVIITIPYPKSSDKMKIYFIFIKYTNINQFIMIILHLENSNKIYKDTKFS